MRAKLKEISDELDDLHTQVRELEYELNVAREFAKVVEDEMQYLIKRVGSSQRIADASIITMYAALVIAAIAIGLLVFVW